MSTANDDTYKQADAKLDGLARDLIDRCVDEGILADYFRSRGEAAVQLVKNDLTQRYIAEAIQQQE